MHQFVANRVGGLEVYSRPNLDGGGAGQGQDYLDFVARERGPRRRFFEWCAGPGYIGFALLNRGLCESLCLADVRPNAVTTSTSGHG